ncbi:MAG: dehydrogenase [Ignavibacteria bacterium CG22_combo_CG10-13_8_21_14_all_37_15]|nr:Gfo/Idh/MocA family oxidoreductase [Ignavibacteria bacterium]OIO15132.1 MAG: dehydrogenase [Ignavibacteria bacterium CG1_02_37_35]PIP78764.1 MAG: dehydrogenase [Ignavibacteria bacterium CG22_combo_CG10-13_8_21_14_all_37_15]PIS45373.1 MAG: gfo/Idh/MocA family oxidoreductase [Ignavibacteria bacterium CG08_land_8_20_14_0_20_37_9]PIX93565.1 MAG: gfo/Idh/MocA family oxidoreductase [Ignavibacteria bacterium CG_4_10_14_3_um_filter_37_18]PJC57962.1 MAG: gfo/Idh/MocA family oxidoreductase [Ignavibac
MNQVNIGIIGLGSIAQLVHLPFLKKLNNANVVAISEINKNRLLTVGEKFGIKKQYSSFEDMLEKENLDAVIIATPTDTHLPIALACIEKKRHVLIEKPISRSLQETKLIVDAAKKQEVKVMVGMNFRYRPDVMLLKSIINSGDLGEIFYVKSGWLRKQSSEGQWFTKKESSGGGVILDLGIVLLDLSLWLLNFPEIASVSTQNFFINTTSVEDCSLSMIRCRPNALINLETSWSLNSEMDTFYLNIYGIKGNASLNPLRVFKKINDQQIDMTPSGNDNYLSLFKKSYLNELKHFLGAVQGVNPLFSPAEESLPRMKVIESMYQSSHENKEMQFE